MLRSCPQPRNYCKSFWCIRCSWVWGLCFHSNPVYEFIQYRGRAQNGNQLVYRRDLKQMIRVLRNGEMLFIYPTKTTVIINLSLFPSLPLKKPVQQQEQVCLPIPANVPSLLDPAFVMLVVNMM